MTTRYVRVVLTKDLPQIVGSDMKTYGPFSAGDEAVLPELNVAVLVKQGCAWYPGVIEEHEVEVDDENCSRKAFGEYYNCVWAYRRNCPESLRELCKQKTDAPPPLKQSEPILKCQDCGIALLPGQERKFYGRKATLILCESCKKARLKDRNMRQVNLFDVWVHGEYGDKKFGR